MIKTLVPLLMLCMFSSAKAQVSHIARFEHVHEWSNIDYIVIPNEEKGVLLVQPMTPGLGKKNAIHFRHLNSELQEDWTGVFEISKRVSLIGYHYVNNVAYLLFQNRENQRFIRIVSVDLKEKKVKDFDLKQIVDLDIKEFEVIKKSIIIGGYIEGRPAVFNYDMVSGNVQTLPNVYQNNSDLLEVRINSDSLTFNVIASEEDEKKDRTVLVNTYDYLGNPVREYQLETAANHQLLSAVSSSINNKSQVITGLYSVQLGTYPSGFYINHVDRTGIQIMKYYNFGEFDTFLDHRGKKRSTKMKERALTAKTSNREWRYKTKALFREIVEEDGKLVIMGEFYKPWTTSTSRNSRFNDNGPMTRTIDRFSNTRLIDDAFDIRGVTSPSSSDINYTHAFSLVLDEDGEILWDGSLDINENIDGPVRRFGDFQWYNGDAYYAYYDEKEFVVSHLNNKEDTEGNTSALSLMNSEDELRFERDEYKGVTRWYDNRYLVYGLQHVKPKDKSSGMRKVFFINAVGVGPNFRNEN